MSRPHTRMFRVSSGLGAAALLCLGLCVSACNALRALFPSNVYESVAPEIPELGETAVLLVTKTNGFRHEEAIAAGVPVIQEIGQRNGWSVFHTENGAVHNAADLSKFDAVVWFQVSGDLLDEVQRAALKAYIEGGGGFVAVHGSGGDGSYEWDWYVSDLIGEQFIGHIMAPQFQEATVVVEDLDHPATRGLPATWQHTEEWYSFEASPRPRGARILMSVDESTYDPTMWMKDLSMGDHPVVWSHCPGAGRAFFSALGHQAVAYEKPEHLSMLEGAIAWAAGLHPGECAHKLAAGSN
ncbi:MAG: ThuA domain-containing protein [Myxococcota bacterium]|nr:ThuA domain-containing protein [Myxococcota bacterium]